MLSILYQYLKYRLGISKEVVEYPKSMYGRCTAAVHMHDRHGVISNKCAAQVADYFVPTKVIQELPTIYNEYWSNECST
jgi:hypothetical protein